MKLKLAQVISDCGFELISGVPEGISITGVSTDSRTVTPGALFVALTGENFDGHDFLQTAIDAGASAIVVQKRAAVPENMHVPVIFAPDTVKALGFIARFWRRQCPATIVAVTGSAGKTTTKDLIVSILSQAGSVTATRANENNEIGVAQTLLRMREDDDFCVLEFGMRGLGEIDYLARISMPEIAVITNIGETHIGRLGSREAIAQAKAELLPYLPEDGAAVLNADDFFFHLMENMTNAPVISFGTGVATVVLERVTLTGVSGSNASITLPSGSIDVHMRIPGRHNALNATAAAAVAYALGIAPDIIRQGICKFRGRDMRGQVIDAPRGFTVINDAYNASPTSVPPALEILAQAPARKVFIFADMLELGPMAEQAHRDIGRLAAENVDVLIVAGELGAFTAQEAQAAGLETHIARDAEEAAAMAREIVTSGDTVLVKASRGMHLEIVVEELLRA